MDVFKANKYPLSVGIICKFNESFQKLNFQANVFGNDAELFSYVSMALQEPEWTFDVSCHGYNHG